MQGEDSLDEAGGPGVRLEMQREAHEARSNPLTHLPGSGPKQGYAAEVGSAPISPTFRDIRTQVANLPQAQDGY
ncbi:hypothetical protein ABZ252_21785 [Streptomyces sp. NPDC006175]|uniref:hypothetical protein n=1 Tax=Streptomyces sp. NPDC006175 TaxID=3154471 RepID=UPI0033A96EF7